MTRSILATLCLLALAACAAETGPPGQQSPGGENPITGSKNRP